MLLVLLVQQRWICESCCKECRREQVTTEVRVKDKMRSREE